MVEDRPAYPLIYLVHIQKTSGTALRAYFRRCFGFDNCLFHGPEINLLSIAESRPKDFLSYRVIGGHVGFGEIPDVILERSPVFVSIIRDPVARVLSHYQHIRSSPEHGMHDQLARRNLFGALRTTNFSALADRMQIEYLCGHKDLPALRECLAKNKYVIGKQEHSQELFDKLSDVFGVKKVRDLHLNVGSPGYVEEIKAQQGYRRAVEIIREMNQDEYEFYNSFGAVWSNI